MWIDSHCHLNHPGIIEKGTPEQIIKMAEDSSVSGMVTICCRISEEIETLKSIAANHDNVWCSIGTHPHDAAVEAEKSMTWNHIVKMADEDPNVIAIGETGLDYYYDNAPREEQRASFRKHIRVCIETGLPLIVHTRDAEEDTMQIIKEEGAGRNLTGVMHCFSGSRWLAEEALRLGFYISFSGIITFKKADDLRETAKIVPLERVLVETDAPFLAPVPFRGQINEPAFVAQTGEFLAQLYEQKIELFAQMTTENFYRLFKKAKNV